MTSLLRFPGGRLVSHALFVIIIWLFVMRFRFSGALFVRGYRAMDIESLLDGLQRGFESFGGVPAIQLDKSLCFTISTRI